MLLKKYISENYFIVVNNCALFVHSSQCGEIGKLKIDGYESFCKELSQKCAQFLCESIEIELGLNFSISKDNFRCGEKTYKLTPEEIFSFIRGIWYCLPFTLIDTDTASFEFISWLRNFTFWLLDNNSPQKSELFFKELNERGKLDLAEIFCSSSRLELKKQQQFLKALFFYCDLAESYFYLTLVVKGLN